MSSPSVNSLLNYYSSILPNYNSGANSSTQSNNPLSSLFSTAISTNTGSNPVQISNDDWFASIMQFVNFMVAIRMGAQNQTKPSTAANTTKPATTTSSAQNTAAPANTVEPAMTALEAAKILNDNLDLFDQAAGIGKKDYLITKKDLEAVANNTSPAMEKQRKAAQYILNNQGAYDALDSAAFGGKGDAVIGGTDLKVFLEKQGLKNVTNSSDNAPWAKKNANTTAPVQNNNVTTPATNTNTTKPPTNNTGSTSNNTGNSNTTPNNTNTGNSNTSTTSPGKGVGSGDTGSSPIIQAQNKNYFVDSVNGSDSNDGSSPEKAWKTLAKVNQGGFQPGDVINFARGSKFDAGGGKSALYVKDSGTADKPITFRSYGTGERPEFIGDAKQQYSNSILTNNADNIVFDGLKVTGAGEYGIHVTTGSDNNVIKNCEATNVGVGFGVRGNNNTITHNDIHDLKLVVNTRGGDDDYGAVGVWLLNANGNEISYNKMINCVGQSYDYGTDGGACEMSGDVSNTKIIGNYVKNTDGFMESSQGSANGVTANTLIADNICEDVRLFTCLHTTDHFKVNYSNFQVRNNTITDTASNLRQMFDFAGAKLGSNIFIEEGNKLIAK